MSPLILKLIRITAFAFFGFFTAKIFVKHFQKKNPHAAMSDPEVIAVAVFVGAIFSGILAFVIKGFFL